MDVRALRARREELAGLVPETKARVVAAEARLLVVQDAVERAEAGMKGVPDHVPDGTWETLTDAFVNGFQAAFGLWVIWPIVIACVVGYFVVHGIATCGDPHVVTAHFTASVLESTRPDVRPAAPCGIEARGNLDTTRCTATFTCDGRVVFQGELDCHDEERVDGTDSDGDPTTVDVFVLEGPSVELDEGTGRGTAGGVSFVVHADELDRGGGP